MPKPPEPETLLESCLKGTIAARLHKLARFLSVSLLLANHRKELIDLAQDIQKSSFAAFTNAHHFTDGKQITEAHQLISNCLLFDKSGRYSSCYMVHMQAATDSISFSTRTLPIRINNVHIQFRHGDDRADTLLGYGENDYLTMLYMAMQARNIIEQLPDADKAGLFIPLGDGAVIGHFGAQQDMPIDAFNGFVAQRWAKQKHFEMQTATLDENPDSRPYRMAYINTFIGPKQMSATQRQLHDQLSKLTCYEHQMEEIRGWFASYIHRTCGTASTKDNRGSTDTKTTLDRINRMSGKSHVLNTTKTVDEFAHSREIEAHKDELFEGLVGIITGNDWARESKQSLAHLKKYEP
jgi:hypothetical protein